MGVCLELVGVVKGCYVVNVYLQENAAEKKELWENIKMSRGGFREGLWCVVGDFNVEMNLVERRGISRSVGDEGQEVRCSFNQFIEEMELIDLPLLGRKFTWYQPNGSAISRLDRFLVSESRLAQWEGVSQ